MEIMIDKSLILNFILNGIFIILLMFNVFSFGMYMFNGFCFDLFDFIGLIRLFIIVNC